MHICSAVDVDLTEGCLECQVATPFQSLCCGRTWTAIVGDDDAAHMLGSWRSVNRPADTEVSRGEIVSQVVL